MNADIAQHYVPDFERDIFCLAIAGPTASGKTALALNLIAEFQKRGRGAEIISVDSALVYRGMDIGTAKPTAAELKIAPHHLIDIIEPTQSFSAADFVNHATQLIIDIHNRGNIAILAGGTMMYFQALLLGLDDLPAQNPHIRAQIDAQAARLGWAALHAQLAQVDAATAARLAPADSQRIQRALEVWHITGRPMSALLARQPRPKVADRLLGLWALNAAKTPQIGIAFASLQPRDRAWLHARIAARMHAMLASDFVAEVQRLKSRGDLHENLPSMRCVGYRQIWQALEQNQPPHIDTIFETACAATRQLAKRQLTWLRSMPEHKIIACDDNLAMQNAPNMLANWFFKLTQGV